MSIQSEITRISGNVADTYSALETYGATMPSKQNSDNLAGTVSTIVAVLYTEQSMTDAQMAIARENIGAAPVSVDTTTDPGAGVSVSYPDGTEINVYE